MEDNFTKQQGEEIVKSILDMAVNYKNLSVKETTGDKTFIATIINKESSGNYTIKMNNATYTNIPSAYGYEYGKNEKVECRANQGNMDLLEIITPKITKSDLAVIDNLTSTSTTNALSANQGRILNETKVSTNNPTFTGIVTLPSTTTIGNVSSDEIGYLNGTTSNIQTQLNDKATISSLNTTNTNLNTEITNRTNADNTLQTNINNETTARQQADTNLQNNIDNISAIRILNKGVITATVATIQSVCTNYIVTEYGRQPQHLDGLIITVTDAPTPNDKQQYMWSQYSNSWIDIGDATTDIATASKTVKGIVQIGDGIDVASGVISTSKATIGLGNVENVRQYSTINPPPYPVTSVNGQTGAIADLVTTNTNQTISGTKTITGNIIVNNQTIAPSEIATLTGVTGFIQPQLNNKIYYNDVLMPTNPFGGKQLYINSLDNALASADKKYYVVTTVHNKVEGGITYPHPKAGAVIADDDYWVDSPIVTTHPSTSAFDGSYESSINCSSTQYLKVHIQFNPFSPTWKPSTGNYFSGYPYGTYFLSYYYVNTSSSAQVRCYNRFASHIIGWHTIDFTDYIGNNNSSGYIQTAIDNGNYQRSTIEFIVYGNETTGHTQTSLTQIDWKLIRPNLSQNGASVTKFGSQKLYSQFAFGDQNTNIVEINPSGNSKFRDGLDLGNSQINNIANATTNNQAVNLGQINILVGNYVPTSRTINGKALINDIVINQSDIGLSNVNNTSDINKPISTATQNALNLKANINNPTFTGNVVVPNANANNEAVNLGQIPTSLPASDVYAWAKQPNKPIYTANEIGALPTSTAYAGSNAVGGIANSAYLFKGTDTRNTNENPLWYMQKGSSTILTEFKFVNVIGLSSIITTTFCLLTTFVSWGDSSGGYPVQVATSSGIGGKIAIRSGISNTVWSSWSIVNDNTINWND